MRYAACHPNRKYFAKGLCRPCYDADYGAKYYANHRERVLNRQIVYRTKHREESKAYQAEYYAKHRKEKLEKHSKYYSEHKEEKKVYATKHSEERRNRRKNQYRRDPNFRVATLLRTRLRMALSGKMVSISAIELLGCSISHLVLYLENQFEPGMSWDNHGEWHIDHVLPVSSFDLSDLQQQKEAFNWLNLQPLWAEDNLKKGAKI